MSETILRIEDLHARVGGKPILQGVELAVPRGEVHALMGPNGSGKSTLANVLMGHPAYEVTRGRIVLEGTDVSGLTPDERARQGMFLAFQYPAEVPGVPLLNLLKTALNAVVAIVDHGYGYDGTVVFLSLSKGLSFIVLGLILLIRMKGVLAWLGRLRTAGTQ